MLVPQKDCKVLLRHSATHSRCHSNWDGRMLLPEQVGSRTGWNHDYGSKISSCWPYSIWTLNILFPGYTSAWNIKISRKKTRELIACPKMFIHKNKNDEWPHQKASHWNDGVHILLSHPAHQALPRAPSLQLLLWLTQIAWQVPCIQLLLRKRGMCWWQSRKKSGDYH